MQVLDPEQVDVVILCGGQGTRLRTVVTDRPKPMADIGGRAFLELLIEHVASFGFRRFILGTGHLGDVIENAFRDRMTGLEIVVSREISPLGTAGGLRNALAAIKSDVAVVMNGDSFCPVDYKDVLASHGENGADATVVVVRAADTGECGNVIFGADHRISSFLEKPEKGRGNSFINAGIYVFQRKTISGIEQRAPLSLERDVFPGLCRSRLFAFETRGPMLDIGTPERYERARRELIQIMTQI